MRFPILAMLSLAALPATAQAAPPTAMTGPAADRTQSTATLTGRVNPRGNPTVVFFRYGPTKSYGAQTADTDVGSGSARRQVTAPIAGLTPFTRIHYRLFARYGDKIVRGEDRVFRTQRQPLGLTLVPSPALVSFNGETTLAGALAGTGNEGRQVVLQANPFPYTQGFLQAGDAHVVGPAGAFAFPILDVPVNTQYRVQVPGRPEVVSPVAFVGVKVSVSTRVRTGRSGRTRFAGRIGPASDGATVQVQKRRNGRWRTVGVTIARENGGTSKYLKRLRVKRRGRFRVLVTNVSGAYVENHGRTVRVRPNRR